MHDFEYSEDLKAIGLYNYGFHNKHDAKSVELKDSCLYILNWPFFSPIFFFHLTIFLESKTMTRVAQR